MQIIATIFLGLVTAVWLSGCGHKGPLVLPETTPAPQHSKTLP